LPLDSVSVDLYMNVLAKAQKKSESPRQKRGHAASRLLAIQSTNSSRQVRLLLYV